ncbi:titin homolog isoform X2 [Prunus yedoensis var. nudiflora]|uniref:Titin homolog isoform X2 n=1 Tax=Prunus yedoensis var. nudiflora TaxID=2094558 RepID=A0A314ZK10_PRUYE|nr:titin homolog isoform X2 [Prunus yedoensis var. nudiflora]
MVAAVDSFTANTYEEARNQRLEENKRKFQDLGISNISKTLTHLTASPNKSQQRVSRPKAKNTCFDLEPRRSSRQRNPIQSYRDDVDIGLPTLRKGSRKTSSSWGSYLARPIEEVRAASYEERSAAFKAAEKLQENLQTENPSFVKSMVRSHGLPSKFCEDHLAKTGSDMVLEDEDGNEYDAVYIGKRAGLSGGWRGFALEHKLDDGDALVFELTEPARFKIYIVKAYPIPSLERFKNNVDKEEITSAVKTSKAAMKTGSESNQKRRSKRGIVPEMDESQTSPESEPNQKRRSKRGTVPAMVDTKTSPDSESIQKRRSERCVVPVMEDSKTSPVLEPNQRRSSKRGMVPEMDDTKTSLDSELNQKRRSKRGTVPTMVDTKTSPDSESIQKRRSERVVVPVMEYSKTTPVLEPNQRRRSKRGMVPVMDDTKASPDSELKQKQKSKRGIVPEMDDTKTSPKVLPDGPKGQEIEQEVSPMKKNEVAPKQIRKKAKANRVRSTENPEGCEVQEASTESPEGCQVKQEASTAETDSRVVKDEKECVARKPRKKVVKERLFRKRA